MNAIFATDLAGGFGINGSMPWPHCSVDLRRFKEITRGHTVVMGRNTWQSNMPTPLPHRRNCVLSSSYADQQCEVFKDITDLNMNLGQDETVFVIGGVSVLWALRSYIKTVYLTTFTDRWPCDVMLDTSKYLEGFTAVETSKNNDHIFTIYTRT